MDPVAKSQVNEQVNQQQRVDDVTRPAPMEPIADRLRAWVAWFGLARIVVAALSMLIVCAGAFWLVRSPPPPAEAVLPQASAGSEPSSTLPLPQSGPSHESSQSQSSGQPGQVAGPNGQVVDAAQDVTVHVAGAVADPGVYQLAVGSRVDDAITAAGGALGDADVDALNLAATLADGVRVYVPGADEVVASVPLVSGGNEVEAAPSGPVDLNRADASELESLPGVGPATAAAIVSERERNGPFLTVADLERVPGIGPAKMAGLSDMVVT